MRLSFSPSFARGSLSAPPSKSMAHRALISAALAQGESVLSPIALSEDMLATMDCLTALGASFRREGETVFVSGMGAPKSTGKKLYCRESGSTLRFLIPLCLLTGEEFILCGAPRLLERPLGVYETLCRENGFLFERDGDGIRVAGKLRGGSYSVPGNISSQFITGLLFALSLVPEESRLEVTGGLESASYIDMTLSAMASFGVRVERKENVFLLSGKETYQSRNFTVEGDYSNAAFLDAFTLVGGDVRVAGLTDSSLQGDRVYRDIFPLIKNGSPTVDLSDCPDLAPVLFALAAYFHGGRFTGTARLRIKESDRGAAMAEELKKCGVTLSVTDNEIIVPESKLSAPQEEIRSHNDHRIAMAMSVLLSRTGGILSGAEAVAKSYPDFFEKIKTLGIEVKEI